MAEPLPPALKIPDVSRFINRANQLRSIKPAIAYWCEYRAVNQIVGKSLHTSDDDAFNYTKALIERLEETKTERADDDAIVDNTAGQAYVEQFAQQTFERAERTLIANKVTRQTADTFDAAATFFDLLHEWGTPEPEVLQKIKFAKWNAARILKAIREGKDPNESNPKIQESAPEPMALDPNDPDVQQLTSPQPASVEDAVDAGEAPAAPTSGFGAPAQGPADEGYFPALPPSAPEPFAPLPLSPSPAPPTVPGMPPPPINNSPQFQALPYPLAQSSTQFPPSVASSVAAPSAPPSWTTTSSAPNPATSNPPPVITPSTSNFAATPPAAPAAPTGGNADGYTRNQKDLNQAQKHAKWAISALNFDDVPTAVQELRNALAVLGG